MVKHLPHMHKTRGSTLSTKKMPTIRVYLMLCFSCKHVTMMGQLRSVASYFSECPAISQASPLSALLSFLNQS